MSKKVITQRKQQHIDAILKDPQIERNQSGFEQIRLTHRALPELDFAKINTKTSFLNRQLSFPLLISSMTGGADKNLVEINQNLAIAAETEKVALAVGSQRAMIVDKKAEQSFQLRQFAPNIPLIANMGAVQLNYDYGLDEAQKMIDILDADALYLHLNPLQEIIQPEGNTDFSRLAEKIANLNDKINIPIILKEVGSGLSAKDIELGIYAGISWFDTAGRGGTSWSRIESHRNNDVNNTESLGNLFQDWGLTTPEVLEIAKQYQKQANFIASGGIRTGIDMVKSVIMGSRICGMASPFLEPAINSSDKVTQKIQQVRQQYQVAQFLLGASDFNALFLNDTLLSHPYKKDN
jgi:isopentenyl-diphosphate delta-isomerase